MSDSKIIHLVSDERDPAAHAKALLEQAKGMGFEAVVIVGHTGENELAILSTDKVCCTHLQLQRAAHMVMMNTLAPG